MNHLFTIGFFFRVGHIIRAGDGEDWRGRERTGEDGRGRERTGMSGRTYEISRLWYIYIPCSSVVFYGSIPTPKMSIY